PQRRAAPSGPAAETRCIPGLQSRQRRKAHSGGSDIEEIPCGAVRPVQLTWLSLQFHGETPQAWQSMRGRLKALRMVERYAAVSPAHRTRAMAFYVTAGVSSACPPRHSLIHGNGAAQFESQ